MTKRDATPRWLTTITVRLGSADYDEQDGARRWMWHDGDLGLRIARRTSVWEVFAWSPTRSVVLRVEKEPTEAELAAASSLAGLGTGPRPTPPVAFTPGIAPVQEAA